MGENDLQTRPVTGQTCILSLQVSVCCINNGCPGNVTITTCHFLSWKLPLKQGAKPLSRARCERGGEMKCLDHKVVTFFALDRKLSSSSSENLSSSGSVCIASVPCEWTLTTSVTDLSITPLSTGWWSQTLTFAQGFLPLVAPCVFMLFTIVENVCRDTYLLGVGDLMVVANRLSTK